MVVSALPSDPARTIESRITGSGLPLFSNASSHRMHPDVPLVIADLDLSPMERFGHGDLGPLACSTNCTVIPVVLPIAALMEAGELTQVSVQTEQALSGGGLGLLRDPSRRSKEVGHPIPGEAEKIEEEFRRLTMVRESTSMMSPRNEPLTHTDIWFVSVRRGIAHGRRRRSSMDCDRDVPPHMALVALRPPCTRSRWFMIRRAGPIICNQRHRMITVICMA